MLDEKTVEIINKMLEQGYDIEIQNRKDCIVVLAETKEYICRKADN
ncbi:MAG: hypothetical protein K6G68_12830 [Oscillospiraceae bacterium]|nr:hypothetical protein [Oscillospiraceae bacterium]